MARLRTPTETYFKAFLMDEFLSITNHCISSYYTILKAFDVSILLYYLSYQITMSQLVHERLQLQKRGCNKTAP